MLMVDKEPDSVSSALQDVFGLLRLFNINFLHMLYSSASRATSWETQLWNILGGIF